MSDNYRLIDNLAGHVRLALEFAGYGGWQGRPLDELTNTELGEAVIHLGQEYKRETDRVEAIERVMFPRTVEDTNE